MESEVCGGREPGGPVKKMLNELLCFHLKIKLIIKLMSGVLFITYIPLKIVLGMRNLSYEGGYEKCLLERKESTSGHFLRI